VFGKRSTDKPQASEREAPPPAPAGAPPIATRPQQLEPAAAPSGQAARPAPRPTPGFEQLQAAQGSAPEIVHEQSEYYHQTKTTIFNALLNTIDLAQLAQLDAATAAEEIREDKIAEVATVVAAQLQAALELGATDVRGVATAAFAPARPDSAKAESFPGSVFGVAVVLAGLNLVL